MLGWPDAHARSLCCWSTCNGAPCRAPEAGGRSVADGSGSLREPRPLVAIRRRRLTIEPNAHSLPNMSDMNKLQFKGSWNEVKGMLKQKYAQLTDDDLVYSEGKDDGLIGKLQKKRGRG